MQVEAPQSKDRVKYDLRFDSAWSRYGLEVHSAYSTSAPLSAKKV